jgi:VanZ family protein
MTVIYLFSDQPYSAEISQRYLGAWNIAMRKLAHLTEYAILFCLTRRALAGAAGAPWKALALCIAYAGLDEWHQAYVPGRSAALADVLVDAGGCCLGWLAFKAASWLKQARSAPGQAARSLRPGL